MGPSFSSVPVDIREAEHHRFLAQYNAGVVHAPNMTLVCVGAWLVSLGERLKSHRAQKAEV